jgi:hypothetical protein
MPHVSLEEGISNCDLKLPANNQIKPIILGAIA